MKLKYTSPGIGFLDQRFVNVTGDTMTGNLTMGTNKIVFAEGREITGSNTMVFTVPAGANMYFGGTSGDYVTLNTVRSPPTFYPGDNHSIRLGDTGNYWIATYTDSLYLNSTAILDGTTAGLVKLDGNLLIEPSTDSTTAVQITKADTTPVFNVDTTNGRVGIGVTDPDTKLEVFGSTGLKISFDATDNTTLVTDTNGILTVTPSGAGIRLPTTKQLQFNDTSTYFAYNSGDLDLYTTAEKTLELQTVVYKDINMAGYLLAKPASSAPDVVKFLDSTGTDTTIETYGFAVGQLVHGGFELQHDYKEGTDLIFHVHWQGITAPTGGETVDNVQWRLNYIVARDGVTLAAATVIDSPDTAIDTQYRCYRTDFGAIDGTDFKIGDQFMFTLTRVAATGDAYAGDALIETAGIHYQIDTVGSRQITIK